ncbi:MAG: indolepyruvate ferredoxin oxidoreductase subunit alpha [Rhizobiales bacterium]|nr:indolepyruvate ferredoxin oxidoreductase subunit alpha [Hyphomicrobiales bacterium]
MPERSFAKEVKQLRIGEGEVFEGEGILAVTKGLLQSGISYVGGYQGAPISHLTDVLSDAQDILGELGIHLETCANEAGAVAMLGASINYPIRGAVTFKSIVGTNVASDALSNLASPGVTGGALIVLGEDYGEGSSIIQERTHAIAMKSQVWLLDPKPDLTTIVDLTEKAFELSEATNTPVMMELRARVCHMSGRFNARDNVAAKHSLNNPIEDPYFNLDHISLPPGTYIQEKLKIEVRWPAAIKFIKENKLNEFHTGKVKDVGIILQGGMYNGVVRALQSFGLADEFGKTDIPLLVLNVVYPLVPDELKKFCKDKKAVLIVEEGQPKFMEHEIKSLVLDTGMKTKVSGSDVMLMAGELNGEAMLRGLSAFFKKHRSKDIPIAPVARAVKEMDNVKAKAAEILGEPVPIRPPGFCTGCPERPIFAAIKLVEEQVGKVHISADIGCHTFAALAPFNLGNTVLGYGLGLASSTGLSSMMSRKVVSIMGDGGFWHNGLTTGIANHVFNQDDGVLIVVSNGYSSATGHQHIPSTGTNSRDQESGMEIEAALRGVGVKSIERVETYKIGKMINTLKDAITTKKKGLKVIIAEGECRLALQRREKPKIAAALSDGKRVERVRYGVDEESCTGDHACIRLSGCPTLTIKESSDPLRKDPVTQVTSGCVGCGNCGEVAHAAILCPSFYRTTIVQNPKFLDRVLYSVRRTIIGWMQRGEMA